MATKDLSVINYTLYEGSTEYMGIAQVDLPSLEFMTATLNGAGIAGELELPLIGQMNAMKMSLKMLVLSKQGIKLSAPKTHTWELREVQETVSSTSTLGVTSVKHIIKAIPISMDGGTLKTQSTSDPTIEASVVYWAEYRDGVKVMELDPLGYVCYFNGTDYLAKVRTALGK